MSFANDEIVIDKTIRNVLQKVVATITFLFFLFLSENKFELDHCRC